jgi:hypothetical protein
MQKAKSPQRQSGGQTADKGFSGEFMGAVSRETTAQLESIIDSRPQAKKLEQYAVMANSSPQVAAQRKMQNMIASTQTNKLLANGSDQAQAVVMRKKDAALAELKPKESGWTATKVIKPKNGSKGIFRFPMSGDNIDTFVGTNNVPSGLTIPSTHQDAENPGKIHVAVSDHNLGAKYKDSVPALSDSDIGGGSRPKHFKHGDDSHGNPSRENSLTWHHKATYGHMELVDMNVHGAFWHYGGIAHWDASKHGTSDADDDGGTS